jgi:hypothetical protein
VWQAVRNDERQLWVVVPVRGSRGAALEGDETIQTVASDLKVDVSTIARHRSLYAVLRDRARDRVDEERFNGHQEAVGQAEATLVKLVFTGRTPTLRNAGVLTGET